MQEGSHEMAHKFGLPLYEIGLFITMHSEWVAHMFNDGTLFHATHGPIALL